MDNQRVIITLIECYKNMNVFGSVCSACGLGAKVVLYHSSLALPSEEEVREEV